MEYTHPYWFRANRARVGLRRNFWKETSIATRYLDPFSRAKEKQWRRNDLFRAIHVSSCSIRIRFQKKKERSSSVEHESNCDDRFFFQYRSVSSGNKKRKFPTSLDRDFLKNLFNSDSAREDDFTLEREQPPLLLFLLILHFSKFL